MTDEERRKRLEEMSSDATKHLYARKQRLEQKERLDKKEIEEDEKQRLEKQNFVADVEKSLYASSATDKNRYMNRRRFFQQKNTAPETFLKK